VNTRASSSSAVAPFRRLFTIGPPESLVVRIGLGGVAHDPRADLLAVLVDRLGPAPLVAHRLDGGEGDAHHADELVDAVEVLRLRARRLVDAHELLALVRPDGVDLGEHALGAVEILARRVALGLGLREFGAESGVLVAALISIHADALALSTLIRVEVPQVGVLDLERGDLASQRRLAVVAVLPCVGRDALCMLLHVMS
jgi:hypothetical protein